MKFQFLVENPWGEGEGEETFRFEWDGSLYEVAAHGDRSPVPCPDAGSEQDILELLAAWYPRATSIEGK